MKAVLIDVYDNGCSIVDIADDLHEFYRVLRCDTIDIVRRRIGQCEYDIICDDEGSLKDNVIVSAYRPNGKACLVGNLLICGATNTEHMVGLTDKELHNLVQNIATLQTEQQDERVVVVNCDYF